MSSDMCGHEISCNHDRTTSWIEPPGMTVDRTISFLVIRIADSWVIEINYVPDCVQWYYRSQLWEGPQLLLAKVKDANGQDWYI